MRVNEPHSRNTPEQSRAIVERLSAQKAELMAKLGISRGRVDPADLSHRPQTFYTDLERDWWDMRREEVSAR